MPKRDIKYSTAEENIKPLTPAQWDKQNVAKGYVLHPAYAAGKRKTDQYKEYYDPKVFQPTLNDEGVYQWTNLQDPDFDFSDPANIPVQRYSAPKPKQIPEISPTTKPLQFTPDYVYNPNSGVVTTNSGQLLDAAAAGYKKGGLIKKYANGGNITKDQKIAGVNLAGQGLNALSGPQDTDMRYGTNDYFKERNANLQTGQGVANAVGAIPIVGAFKAVGEGAQNVLAKKDAYGVSDSSDAAIAAGGFLNPLESTTSAFSDIKSGKFNAKTAANLILPGLGAVLNNRENKKNRDALMAGQQTEEKKQENAAIFNKNLIGQLASRNSYSKGGKIVGKGTGKSDSIKASIKEDSFVVPAKNADAAKMIRKNILGDNPNRKAPLKQKSGEKVKVSNGEHLFSEDEVMEIKAEGIDLNALAPEAQHELREHLNCGGKVKGYAKGGSVAGEDPFEAARKKAIADSREADLAERKALMEEFKMLKDKANSGNPVDRFTYNKRLPEIGNRLKQINEKHGLTGGSQMPSKTGADIERIMGAPQTRTGSGLAKTVPSIPKVNTAQDSLNRAMTTQDADNSVIVPPAESKPVVGGNALDNANPTVDPNLEAYNRDLAARTAELTPAQSNTGRGNAFKNGLSSLINYGIPLAQAGIGLNFLKKAGPRPIDSIDPEYTNALANAKTRASYGFTPEEQALINNQNANLMAAQRSAARQYSGGSAANALNLERQAVNDSFGRGLSSALANRNLQLNKQQYADQLGLNKVELSRRLFNDKLNAWNQNQMAASQLLNTGLSNLVGANRYEQEKDAIAQNNQIANNWINSF